MPIISEKRYKPCTITERACPRISLAESPKDIPDETVEYEVKKYVDRVITESYALAETKDLDPFSLKGKYHKKYGKKKDVEIDFSLDIKVVVSDA